MSEEARLAAILEVRLNRIDEKLSDFNRKIANSMKKSQKDMDAANDNWAKLFGKKPNLAKALDGVIDNTRLKVLDSGVARVGLFGSALENLGPAGLGAAAAVGAFALAANRARDAAAFGDEIGDAATKLHVTTDALQEFRYANRLAGGDIEGADAALESFGATLGKAQAGLPKAQKAFKELGFTTAQIKSFKTVEDGLDAVTERIGKLKSDPQKDAVVDQLGLTGIKTLVEGGLDSMRALKGEAKSLGLVMDAGLIARAGIANDKFESLERIIDVQLKSAFVDLAPVMLNLLKIAGDMAREFADVVAYFEKIENHTADQLGRDQAKILARMNTAEGKGYPNATNDGPNFYLPGEEKVLRAKLAKINAALAKLPATGSDDPGVPGGGQLRDLDAEAKAEQDRLKALQRAGASQQLIDEATKNELSARQALVHDLQAQADLKAKEVDAEAAKSSDKIASDLAQGRITKAAADTATALNDRATHEKKAAIAADLTTQLEESRLNKQRELAGILDATSSTYAGLARTVDERRKIELKILEQQHKDRIDELNTRLNQADREGRTDDVAHIQRLVRAEDGNYDASKKQVEHQNLNPLDDWLDKAPASIGELNEQLQSLEAQGLDSLNQGLADAIVNSKSLGSAAANVFKQLEVQILQMLLEAGEAKLASTFGIPGFASGGYTGPGGVNTPRGVVHAGEVVFDQPAVARLGVPFLEALRKGKASGFAKGGVVGFAGIAMPSVQSLGGRTAVVQQFFPSFKGAVVTEDLMASFKSYADDVGQHAARLGAQGGAALVQSQMQQAATLRLGK